jgi:hypothetical protein
MKGFSIVVKVDPLRVARGPRRTPRAVRFGCGKHPKRASAKRSWQRDQN